MKIIRRLLIVFILSCCCTAAFGVWYLQQNIPVRDVVEVEIPTGATLGASVKILRKNNAVLYPALFQTAAKIYATISKKRLSAGFYRFNSSTTHWQLLAAIFSGKQAITVNVVFPEGITIQEFAAIASRQIGIDSVEFMELATSDSLRKAREIPGKSVEGYIMPDTYNFFWKQRPDAVLDRLLNAHETMWKQFAAEAGEQKKSKKEILTLASIIEAETPLDDEKKTVAGLYSNRLEKNMKLEADPTVQYALSHKKRLTYKDLETNSPYNTYRFAGLPPGPINSPGKASIEAALFPEQHSYLFFVARGDGSGGHTFSEQYSEHQRAVQLYRKRRTR